MKLAVFKQIYFSFSLDPEAGTWYFLSMSSPAIRPMTQCDRSLDFHPQTAWPTSLPAVAVNGVVLAGFKQDLVFNHSFSAQRADFSEQVANLFRSLYFELSFVEISQLIAKAKSLPWFPAHLIAEKFGMQADSHFCEVSEMIVEQPVGFQKWCIERKIQAKDLSPLLVAKGLNLKSVQLQILNLQMTRAQGREALELCIELFLIGKNEIDLKLISAIAPEQIPISADEWLRGLRHLRFPDAQLEDSENERKLSEVPWPGTSQARWVRQGAQAGVELRLFVSNPSDLRKYLQSLSKVQELLERAPDKSQILN